MKVSIVIRTYNEERWITSCLKAVFSQNFKDFEVVIVDNDSSDSTLAKVAQFPIKKIEHISDYLPGKSLNIGFRVCEGEFIVCLSGHCIPTDPTWLEKLLQNFEDERVAAVYGRQQPLSFTPPSDKRDLMVIFGPERKVQWKDSFFHNANSMVRRSRWEEQPWDDAITNIEDRLWANQVQEKGHCIIYEPEASVYHYHGIHQNGNEVRCHNVVRILESLQGEEADGHKGLLKDLDIVCMIPIKGESLVLGDRSLLARTIQAAQTSELIKTIAVSSDNKQNLEEAQGLNVDHTLKRDSSLSADYIGLEAVYKNCLDQLEELGVIPDVVVLLEVTHPFRDGEMIDSMIEQLASEGMDTVLPARNESNAIWMEKDKELERIDDGLVPRKYRDPVILSCKGLCCVTRAEFIRNERVIGDKIGIHPVSSSLHTLEVRGPSDIEFIHGSFMGLVEDP